MLKNTFCKSHYVGLNKEEKARDYFIAKGYSLLAERYHCPFAEVDLLFRTPKSLLIIEVKSISRFDFILTRVSKRQKVRLCNAQLYIQEKFQIPTEILVVYVDSSNSIIELPLE